MGRVATAWQLWRSGRREDLRAALERSFFPARIYRVNEMVIARLTSPRPLPRPLDSVRIRWAGVEDEPLLQRIRPRKGGYRRNFETSLCLMGEVGGEPASFNFFEHGDWHVSRSNAYRFALGPQAVWAWGFEVHPRFRMSGVFAKQWVEALPLLREKGFSRIYGSIQADNPRSLKSHRRLGFEFLYRFRVRRLLGTVRHWAVPEKGMEGLEPGSGWGPWVGRDTSDSLGE